MEIDVIDAYGRWNCFRMSYFRGQGANSILNIIPPLINENLIIAVDQATHVTGCVIGNLSGVIYYVFQFIRSSGSRINQIGSSNISNEESIEQYKLSIQAFIREITQYCEIKIWICEDIFYKGYYHSNQVLSYMKMIGGEYMAIYGISSAYTGYVKQQVWKSNLLKNRTDNASNKVFAKERVMDEIYRRFPLFPRGSIYNDACDAIGIYIYIIDNLVYDGVYYKVTKSTPKDYRHKIIYDIQQLQIGESLKFSQRLVPFAKRKIHYFLPCPSLSLDDNMRSVTTNSNALWVSGIIESMVSYEYARYVIDVAKQREMLNNIVTDFGNCSSKSNVSTYIICTREHYLPVNKAILDFN